MSDAIQRPTQKDIKHMILSIGTFKIKADKGSTDTVTYHDLKIDFGAMTPELIASTLCAQSQSLRVKLQNSVLRPEFKRDGEWPEDDQTFDFVTLYERAEKRSARETVLEREIQKAEAEGDHAHADILREVLDNA